MGIIELLFLAVGLRFFEAEAQRNLIAAMDEDCMFCFGFQIGAKLMLELIRPQTP